MVVGLSVLTFQALAYLLRFLINFQACMTFYSLALSDEMNGTIMKYETKKKHQIYVETLAGKKIMGKEESFTMNFREIIKYNGIENKT